MRDSQYKDHLIEELNDKKDAAVAALEEKLGNATEETDEAFQTLCDNLEAKEAELADSNNAAQDMLADFADDLIADTMEEAEERDAEFCEDALAEQQAKEEFAD